MKHIAVKDNRELVIQEHEKDYFVELGYTVYEAAAKGGLKIVGSPENTDQLRQANEALVVKVAKLEKELATEKEHSSELEAKLAKVKEAPKVKDEPKTDDLEAQAAAAAAAAAAAKGQK